MAAIQLFLATVATYLQALCCKGECECKMPHTTTGPRIIFPLTDRIFMTERRVLSKGRVSFYYNAHLNSLYTS